MEDRLFPHLLANEPKAKELTKKQYDDLRNIEQFGQSGTDKEDVDVVLPEATSEEKRTPISGENTKKEIIEEILRRGTNLTRSELNRKNKSQLLDLI